MIPDDVMALTPVELTGFIGYGLGFMDLVLLVVFLVVVGRRKNHVLLRAYHTWPPRLRTGLKVAGYTVPWPIAVLWAYGMFWQVGSGNSQSSDLFLNIVGILVLSTILVLMVISVL